MLSLQERSENNFKLCFCGCYLDNQDGFIKMPGQEIKVETSYLSYRVASTRFDGKKKSVVIYMIFLRYWSWARFLLYYPRKVEEILILNLKNVGLFFEKLPES